MLRDYVWRFRQLTQLNHVYRIPLALTENKWVLNVNGGLMRGCGYIISAIELAVGEYTEYTVCCTAAPMVTAWPEVTFIAAVLLKESRRGEYKQ